MAYLCKHYPFESEISNARLTKMVYLADWFAVQQFNHQLTNINWYFDNYGPYVNDVVNEANNNPIFKIISGQTIYGTPKLQIKLSERFNDDLELPDNEQYILDKVIQETKSLNWNNFIQYVYNTPPVKNAYRYSYLDLYTTNE